MIRIRSIKIRQWFPPGDRVATAVAMLCILREDLLLELYGITNDKIERVDDNSTGYRRTYFWRNSLRTLEEIRRVMNRLNSHPAFREALSNESLEVQQAFRQATKELNKASGEFLAYFRKKIAAHLDEALIEATLDEMDWRREGLLQLGDIRGKIHYQFAGELIWASVLHGVPNDQQEARMNELLGRSAKLSQAVSAIDDAIACYARERRLPQE